MMTSDPIKSPERVNIADQMNDLQRRLHDRLTRIKHVVAVMSGKGGVGKSTLTANLAAAMAKRGLRIGVVDGDLYGPSLARLFGLNQSRIAWQTDGAIPARAECGVALMSMALMLPNESTPLVWQGSQEAGFAWKGNLEMHALREFIGDTAWGDLDMLLVDLPPGTNQFATLCELLDVPPKTLVITTKAALAREVVARSLNMAKHHIANEVLGTVVNMAGYFCPSCQTVKPLFGNTEPNRLELEPPMALIPFDYRMNEASEVGRPFILDYPDSATGSAIFKLTDTLIQQVHESPPI